MRTRKQYAHMKFACPITLLFFPFFLLPLFSFSHSHIFVYLFVLLISPNYHTNFFVFLLMILYYKLLSNLSADTLQSLNLDYITLALLLKQFKQKFIRSTLHGNYHVHFSFGTLHYNAVLLRKLILY